MNKNIILCLFFISARHFACAVYSDCGSKIGNVTSVLLNKCASTDPRCIIFPNTDVTIQISFIAKRDIEEVYASAYISFMWFDVTIDLPNPYGCQDSGLTCPLKSGVAYSYTTSFPVLQSYPTGKEYITFELQNQGSADISCTKIDVLIK